MFPKFRVSCRSSSYDFNPTVLQGQPLELSFSCPQTTRDSLFMLGLVSFDARLTRPDSNTPHLSWLVPGTEFGWLALPVAGGVGDSRFVRPVVVIFPGIRHATVGYLF